MTGEAGPLSNEEYQHWVAFLQWEQRQMEREAKKHK